MMDCRRAAQKLHEYLDKELSPEDVSLIEEHLEDCGHCAGFVEFDKALRALIKKKVADPKLSDDLKQRILNQIPPRDRP